MALYYVSGKSRVIEALNRLNDSESVHLTVPVDGGEYVDSVMKAREALPIVKKLESFRAIQFVSLVY